MANGKSDYMLWRYYRRLEWPCTFLYREVLLWEYQTSHIYMRVVFSSLVVVVSCQGHCRDDKLESSNRNRVVSRSRKPLNMVKGYNLNQPALPFYRVAGQKVSSYCQEMPFMVVVTWSRGLMSSFAGPDL